MNLIERYAMEAGVEGYLFLKGMGVENIYIYMYKEISKASKTQINTFYSEI